MFHNGPHIFLIDDDEDDLIMLSSSLEELGFRVMTFASGVVAMAYIHGSPVYAVSPSLIILDYNMPGMNGLETLSLIKKSENMHHIPVVLYSTIISPLFEMNARKLGACSCKAKANNLTEFEEHVACFSHIAHSFRENNANVNVIC